MKRILLILACLLCLCPDAFAAEQRASTTSSNGRPYYIMVNRAMNTVTVFGLDEEGYYTVPVKAMVCSTGRQGHATPRGTYSITNARKEWCLMVDGTYGQYSSQFNGHILFHSICYSRPSHAALITEEYNRLGTAASLGCVRLQVGDAKWIFDNCGPGTKVTVYESDDPGPLGKPDKIVDEITPELANGWDPTDPAAGNPWETRFVRSVELDRQGVSLTAGEKTVLTASAAPETALFPKLVWSSTDPSVASVDEDGTVVALGPGYAEIYASCGDVTAACGVTVREELLPMEDLVPGAWYYPAVRYVYEREIMGAEDGLDFLPYETVSRAEAVQTLYDLALTHPEDFIEEAPEPEETAWYEDLLSWAEAQLAAAGEQFQSLLGTPALAAEEEEPLPPPWYAEALAWAVEKGVVEPETEEAPFAADDAITRQEFAALLYRYAASRAPEAAGPYNAGDYQDAAELTGSDGTSLLWAAANEFMNGSADGQLHPARTLSRAELAAVIQRYDHA